MHPFAQNSPHASQHPGLPLLPGTSSDALGSPTAPAPRATRLQKSSKAYLDSPVALHFRMSTRSSCHHHQLSTVFLLIRTVPCALHPMEWQKSDRACCPSFGWHKVLCYLCWTRTASIVVDHPFTPPHCFYSHPIKQCKNFFSCSTRIACTIGTMLTRTYSHAASQGLVRVSKSLHYVLYTQSHFALLRKLCIWLCL
jgi:hypothetical protein